MSAWPRCGSAQSANLETPPQLIGERFSVVLEWTVRELHGVPCLDLEDITSPKQQIMASRSFGTPVFDLEQLSQAMASQATRAAEKLRAQGCVAGAITVSIRSNPFKPWEPQYNQGAVVPLDPSTDTRTLIKAALWGLNKIYRTGGASGRSPPASAVTEGRDEEDYLQPG